MTPPVSAIRNIGPRSVESFARAGLHSADEVRALGAEETYRRLILAGTRPHFIGFYTLWLGLQGRLWTDIAPDEKAELRVVFDRLVAGTRREEGRCTEIEAALDMLGVREAD